MKKKHIILIIVILVVGFLAYKVGELAGLYPWQYISEDKVNAFIGDGSYAFTYSLPTEGDKVEWDSILNSDLANQIAASTYAARNNFALDVQGDAYIIPGDALDNEKNLLFNNLDEQDFSDSQLLTYDGNGYALHLAGSEKSRLGYEIVDTFLGIKGSEATRVRVLYKLNGQQCELVYVLAEDDASPYTFKVVDVSICEEQDSK